MAVVYADQRNSLTGLSVQKGELYRITAAPDQFWFDANRRNVPPKGEPGSTVMNSWADYKRLPGSGWFALMASVVETNSGLETMPPHDLSVRPVFETDRAGSLTLFPNDVPLFYGNNKGHVWVCVEKVESKDPPPAVGSFCSP